MRYGVNTVYMPIPTRDRLLDAARDLYLEKGLAGFSLRAVAREVGITAPGVYRHFANRDALLIALLEEGYRRFVGCLAPAEAADTPEQRMEAAGEAYLQFAVEQPGYYTLMFSSRPMLEAGDLPDQLAARMQDSFGVLQARVDECMASGWQIAPGGDPKQIARSIWALSHGLVSLYLAGHWGDDLERFRREYRNAHELLRNGYRNA